MDIGKALRKVRKEKGISQKELAFRTGLSANSICSIENNICVPTEKNMARICETLEIPRAYLLLNSITDDDIPQEVLHVFKTFVEPLKRILLEKE